MKDNGTVRKWESGATRDTDNNKYDYEGFYNPLVIEAFAKYMHKNRFQKDGSVRGSDNWQNLFGEEHLDICMKSGFRHFMDWWMEHRGYESREGIDDALCGLMFNIMAYYYKILKDRTETNEKAIERDGEEVCKGKA